MTFASRKPAPAHHLHPAWTPFLRSICIRCLSVEFLGGDAQGWTGAPEETCESGWGGVDPPHLWRVGVCPPPPLPDFPLFPGVPMEGHVFFFLIIIIIIRLLDYN